MKIIALPDLHGVVNHLETITGRLSAADLVLLVGDLTNAGGTADASCVVDAVRQYNESILAVPGNWDGPEVSAYLTQEGINIHRRNVIIDQIAFIGVGASLLSFNNTPNEVAESDFKMFLEEAVSGLGPSTLKVLVCHQPPIGTLTDEAWGNLHLGSKAIRAFIEDVQPLVCFAGHVHEGVGIDTIGNTKIINPGPLWQGGYAYAEVINQELVALEVRKR
jgi:Icc-related predicted phosphoesterase